jgi:Arc/MetJ-type ribon-helix-helix transcriptional regulator
VRCGLATGTSGGVVTERAVPTEAPAGPNPGPRIPNCIPFRCASQVASEQIAVRVPEELLAVLDELVSRGVYGSRAAAVRAGIEAVLELDRRHLIDLAVMDGYRRTPPTQADREAALGSLREAIVEEPW